MRVLEVAVLGRLMVQTPVVSNDVTVGAPEQSS